MDIEVTGSAEVTVITPRGDLGMGTADQMKRTLTKLVDDGSRKLLVDLGQVGYVDSSGMGALVASLKHARIVGGDLRLCALQEDVRAIFEAALLGCAWAYRRLEETLEDLEYLTFATQPMSPEEPAVA